MKKIIFILAVFALSSCGYKFNGASIPGDMKTATVQYFENNADGMKTELDNAKTLGQARTAIEAKVVEANMRMWAEYYSAIAMAGMKATDGSQLYNNPYDSYGQVREGTNEKGRDRVYKEHV